MLRNTIQETCDLPDDSTDHDGMLTAKDIREETGTESTQPGTTSHGGCDTTLDIGTGTLALGLTINVFERAFVEVTEVGLSGDNRGHGRNIKTKEATTDDGDGRNGIHIADLPHGERRGSRAYNSTR